MKLFLFIIASYFLVSFSSCSFLNLVNYEVVEFHQNPIGNQFNRGHVMTSEDNLHVYLNAYNQSFVLNGTRHKHSHQIIVHMSKNSKRKETSYFYKGLVNNDQDSFFRGYISNDKFLGVFAIKNRIYHVEEPKEQKSDKKAIVYSDLDLHYDTINDNTLNQDKSAIYSKSPTLRKKRQANDRTKYNYLKPIINKRRIYRQQKIKRQFANFWLVEQTKKHHRHKKSKKKIINCWVNIIVDHLYANMHSYNSHSISNELNLIFEEANNAYQEINSKLEHDIALKIENIEVFEHTKYDLGDTSLSIEKILEILAFHKQESCIKIAVLNRDFGEVVGLGHLGNEIVVNQKPQSGFCAKLSNFNGQLVMLNKAVITVRQDNKLRSRSDITHTLCHEIGHLFGAKHDENEISCQKTINLMSSYLATNSEKKSFSFSPCSVERIKNVILSRENVTKCLT